MDGSKKIGLWAGIAENIVHTITFNYLTDAFPKILFQFKLFLLRKPCHPIFTLNIFVVICIPSSNLYQSGIKSELFLIFYYKPPLVSREDKYVVNLPHDKNHGKNGEKNEPNKHGKQNSPKMPVLIEYGVTGCDFIYHPNMMMEICLMKKDLA